MELHNKEKAIYIKYILIQPVGKKHWVKVIFSNGTYWIPKLKEQAEIARKVCECEDVKYPYGEGRKMTIKYLLRAMRGEMNLKELSEEFNIPINRKL